MWWKFLQAVRSGEHRIAPMTWVAGAGALLYALWPLDLIADMLLPFGVVDDLGVWAVVVMLVTREKQRWEAHLKDGAIDVDGRVDPA